MSERYDYRKVVERDVRMYIEEKVDLSEYIDREEAYDDLFDRMWLEDKVTGNGSGSYTLNRNKAEENICHNLDLLCEALENFGYDLDLLLKNGAEMADVTIRCYLLGEMINIVLDEHEW